MSAVLAAGAVSLFAVAVAVHLVRRHLMVVTVKGASMLPTLRTGDRVLVRRTSAAAVRTGDVVVVDEPRPCRPGGARAGGWVVKRVVAAPGEPAPPFLPPHQRAAGDRVPAGWLVLLGDNAEASRDSRHYGPVGAERLLGVVVRRLDGRRLPHPAAPWPQLR